MSLFGNINSGVGGSLGGFNFGNTSGSTNIFNDKLNPTNNTNVNSVPSFFNQNQSTSLFGSNINKLGPGMSNNNFLKPLETQTQPITSNMLNLPLQQRQELERIEKRKISLQKGLSSQINPGMTAFTYQLDEKAVEKQQEVDNYIYYNLNEEEIIKNLNNAKKLNPNPEKCYTLPIKGFGELVQREKQQRKDLENLLVEMKAVKDSNLKIMQTINTNTLKRVEECKKRHQTIIHQLIHISCMIEDLGDRNNFAQINYQLDNQLNYVLHQIQENHMKLGIWQSSINQIETNIKCIEEHLNEDSSKYFSNFNNLFGNNPADDNSFKNNSLLQMKHMDATQKSESLSKSQQFVSSGISNSSIGAVENNKGIINVSVDNNSNKNGSNSNNNSNSINSINNINKNDNPSSSLNNNGGNCNNDNSSNDVNNNVINGINNINDQDARGLRDSSIYRPTNTEIIFETLDNQQQLLESLQGTIRNDLLSLQQFITMV
ncbi:hypothetical protein FG386_001328 [Cryptosporidium ryanae]|uniref:uncharacterized protein n=1 Tax=Cryptosporidium ryanae TaxID=515981 RepID=UPI00351A4BB0|nr:hypothetical protein FG386_001328 [Cryptosporidium ryanae]